MPQATKYIEYTYPVDLTDTLSGPQTAYTDKTTKIIQIGTQHILITDIQNKKTYIIPVHLKEKQLAETARKMTILDVETEDDTLNIELLTTYRNTINIVRLAVDTKNKKTETTLTYTHTLPTTPATPPAKHDDLIATATITNNARALTLTLMSIRGGTYTTTTIDTTNYKFIAADSTGKITFGYDGKPKLLVAAIKLWWGKLWSHGSAFLYVVDIYSGKKDTKGIGGCYNYSSSVFYPNHSMLITSTLSLASFGPYIYHVEENKIYRTHIGNLPLDSVFIGVTSYGTVPIIYQEGGKLNYFELDYRLDRAQNSATLINTDFDTYGGRYMSRSLLDITEKALYMPYISYRNNISRVGLLRIDLSDIDIETPNQHLLIQES